MGTVKVNQMLKIILTWLGIDDMVNAMKYDFSPYHRLKYSLRRIRTSVGTIKKQKKFKKF